jgi:LacI family transcriptional regulator
VAKKAGVSPTTVSVVLNGRENGGISEDTRKRVRDAATVLGYRPHGLARALARGRTDVFGIVLFNEAPASDGDSYFLRTVLNLLLMEVLRSKRNPMLFASLSYDPMDPYLLSDGRADAFILISPPKDEPIVAFLEQQRQPFVAIGARGDFKAGAWVDVDNAKGVADAVAHLAAAGHRRIAHLAGPKGIWDADMRRTAFVREMKAHDLPVPDPFVISGAFIASEAEAAALALLSRPDRPTAIFAGNDNMAIGVYRAASRLGLRIPDDLSVVGFDDIGHAQDVDPPLTTVRQPLVEMARRAVELLGDLCAPAEQRPLPQVFPTTLVERRSVTTPSPLRGGSLQ